MWLEKRDGDWLNTAFIQELRIVEVEQELTETDHDLYVVLAITYILHESISHELFVGSEAHCRDYIKELNNGQGRAQTFQ
jgi:hypothetical protein